MWLNSVTPANVVAEFRKTGVYPFNQDAISCTDVSVSENQDEEGYTIQVLNSVFLLVVNIFSYFRCG